MPTSLDPKAFALRPLRIDVKNNAFIHYEATTWPANPYAGCEMMLRRVALFGVASDDSSVAVDVLAENGDILDTIPIPRHGFEYLRRVLKFKRERDDV
jgi:hypothetical protein